jgi:glycosyltransferase involved in cell wall biosynthesis
MLNIGFVIRDLEVSGAPWNYIYSLVTQLQDRDDLNVAVIYSKGDPSRLPDGITRIERPERLYPSPLLPDRPRMPRLRTVEREHEIDLFHLNELPDLGHWEVARCETPVVATVHGTLQWERLPVATYPTGYRLRRRLFDRLGSRTIREVFSVSQYVKRVLVNCAGYSSNRVSVTYEAIEDDFFDMPDSPPDDVPEPYILHVSSQAPKKNVKTLLRAFKPLRERRDIELVIAGRGWQSECEALVADLGVAEAVHFEGYVPRNRLVQLYDGAVCFAFPSYHETFGLPNVEAMARGTPVVTSSRHAIPEITDGGALLINDPGNPEELRGMIERVLDDDDLREKIVKRGKERASEFKWDRHVKTVVERYAVVCDGA